MIEGDDFRNSSVCSNGLGVCKRSAQKGSAQMSVSLREMEQSESTVCVYCRCPSEVI